MRHPHHLASGLILEIAIAVGIDVVGHGRKRSVRCPLHQDTHPSAFLDLDRNVFYCSVCTPDVGWGARRFGEALGVPWDPSGRPSPPTLARAPGRTIGPSFTAADARRVWDAALARSRDDAAIDDDRPVYDFLHSRGLLDAWELGAFGIVAAGMDLPATVAGWPRSGHQVLVPLFDSNGNLANIQARAIWKADKKTRFPFGSRAKGTLFASRSGLTVLRGQWTGTKVLILGEGLTDFLALSITAALPVLSAPGSGLAAHSIGPWISGFTVLLALDNDSAGNEATDPTARQVFVHGGARVRRLQWPSSTKDACDLLQQYGVSGVAAAIEGVRRGC